MKTVFVSDAHLKGPEDPSQPLFAAFLDGLKDVSTLVMLGDVFDFWTGANSVVEEKYSPVLSALLRVKDRGASIVYCEGNHDFSMGPFFTERLGAEVYPEFAELSLEGKRVLAAHGDTVAMTPGYRLWRAYLRSPAFRLTARIVTPGNVWRIAMGLSKRSRQRSFRLKSNVTEVNLKRFALERLKSGYDCVVFGHSHLAGVHPQASGLYANPGSWRGGSFLSLEKGVFRVETWKG